MAIEAYATQHFDEFEVTDFLGHGQDGVVYATTNNSAIKSFYRERVFENERNCYERLKRLEIVELSGFAIPELIDFSDELLIIEIGLVSPPRVLDFGKAYLDRPADFPESVMDEQMDIYREYYSEEDWARVESVVLDLKFEGIYYYDLRPGNIQVRPE